MGLEDLCFNRGTGLCSRRAVFECGQPWDRPKVRTHHPQHGSLAILTTLELNLPGCCRVHLFGVKGVAIEYVKMFGCDATYESMACDYGAPVKARRIEVLSTMMHRSNEMTNWMERHTIGWAQRLPTISDSYFTDRQTRKAVPSALPMVPRGVRGTSAHLSHARS